MAQASTSHGTSAISAYHTGRSLSTTPSSSSMYSYSLRIQSMINNRGDFSNDVEFDIENSRVHWSILTNSTSSGGASSKQFEAIKKRRPWGGLSKLIKVVTLRKGINEVATDMDTKKKINEVETIWSVHSCTDSDIPDIESTKLANHEHFEMLKDHPEWGGFFKDIQVVLGEKINEGAQAEIYDAKVKFVDENWIDYGYYAVKLMKGNRPLQDFQKQWPVGMLCNVSKDSDKGPLMWIKGGTLINDRFAFVMVRQWGDLRKYIDLKMQWNNNQGPPFENLSFVADIMFCIARDMKELHTRYGIVHRDLKASNVLLWSTGAELPDKIPYLKATVVDYECSIGVIGTGFWRAPEILQQLKVRIPSSELVISKMSDVYSYGMTCYEILTGCIPFEGSTQDCDLVLQGNRPNLPSGDTFDHFYLTEIIKRCWEHEPLDRPTFSRIVKMFEMKGFLQLEWDMEVREFKSQSFWDKWIKDKIFIYSERDKGSNSKEWAWALTEEEEYRLFFFPEDHEVEDWLSEGSEGSEDLEDQFCIGSMFSDIR